MLLIDYRATASDHNPNPATVVCAIDVLGDDGMSLDWFAEHLKRTNHRAVKYVIFNRAVWSKARAGEGWRTYSGSNPHTGHVHVSVGEGPDGESTGPYDDTSPWGLLKEEDVSWQEDLWVPQWMMDRWGDAWPDRRIGAGPLLMSAYGQSRAGHEATATVLAEQRAGQKAILAAVQGLDTDAVIAAVQQRGAEDAARDAEVQVRLDAAAQERAAIAGLVTQVGSGERDAQAVVDEIARRLAPVEPAPAGDQG